MSNGNLQSPFGRPPRRSQAAPAPSNPTPIRPIANQRRRTPDPAPQPKIGIGSLLLIAGALIVVAGIFYGLFYVAKVKPTQGYTSHYVSDDIPAEFTRQLPDAAPEVPISKIFSDQNVQLYKDGAGRKISLKMKYKNSGKTAEQFTFDLIPQTVEEFASVGKGIRKQYVNGKKEELEKLVARFSGPPLPRKLKFIVLFDDTSRDSDEWRAMLGERFQTLNVEERVANGDSATLFFHRLTSKIFYNGRSIHIEGQGFTPEYRGDIEKALDEITSSHGGQRFSSIGTGLFNALAEDGADENTRVLIVSDGLENSSQTISFENGPFSSAAALSDQSKWPEIKAQLQSLKTAPDCNDAVIDWWLPPKQDKAPVMIAALKIWTSLLHDKGCQVQMHF